MYEDLELNNSRGCPRTVLITVASCWDAHKLIAKASVARRFEEWNIVISPCLNQKDQKSEREILKKRRSLIGSGIARERLKIKSRVLHLNGEINPVPNCDSSGIAAADKRLQIYIEILCENVRSLFNAERPVELANFVLVNK